MINSFIFFFGLLTLFIIGKVSFIIHIIILFCLTLIAQIKNLSIIRLVRKIKYFLLALLIIYPVMTPGELIFHYSFFSISYEGLFLAVDNICRLLSIFILVMILFDVLKKEFFLRFLIKICYPLSFIGLDIKRLTARLYLTFEYLEIYKKFEFNLSSLANNIIGQLNINNVTNLDKKIRLIKPDQKDYLWFLLFIFSISIIQILI